MLTAILKSKAGRIQLHGEETRVRWREVFQRSEDLLTSVFFSRLRFLSPQSLTRMMGLLLSEQVASELGELQRIEFWPRLDGAKGRSWVEPDVRMHFTKALVVVEVKPPFGGIQRIEQWRDQIQALAQEWTEEDDAPRHFHYVSLGNNTLRPDAAMQVDFGVEDAFVPVLHQAEWHPIAQALPSLRVHATVSDKAVFDDWREAFALFGIAVQPPFQWSDLLLWADSCDLQTAEVPWPVCFTQPCAASLPQALVSTYSKEPKSGRIDWSALEAFSINHPLKTR